MRLTFGKYKDISIDFVNSGYLKWLIEQDWFEEKFQDQWDGVTDELSTRDYEQAHFYADKVHI